MCFKRQWCLFMSDSLNLVNQVPTPELLQLLDFRLCENFLRGGLRPI